MCAIGKQSRRDLETGPRIRRSGELPPTAERVVEERAPMGQKSEELQVMAPSSQGRRGLLRGSGNTVYREGWQRVRRRDWVWRICPQKWAKGERKPLQEEEHSAGKASKEQGEVV